MLKVEELGFAADQGEKREGLDVKEENGHSEEVGESEADTNTAIENTVKRRLRQVKKVSYDDKLNYDEEEEELQVGKKQRLQKSKTKQESHVNGDGVHEVVGEMKGEEKTSKAGRKKRGSDRGQKELQTKQEAGAMEDRERGKDSKSRWKEVKVNGFRENSLSLSS